MTLDILRRSNPDEKIVYFYKDDIPGPEFDFIIINFQDRHYFKVTNAQQKKLLSNLISAHYYPAGTLFKDLAEHNFTEVTRIEKLNG